MLFERPSFSQALRMQVRLFYVVFFVSYLAVAVQSAQCDVEKIQFPGLEKGIKRLYQQGESFVPSCAKGYTVAKPNGKLVCNNGVWNGHFPPCVAANCIKPPPDIQHGKAKSNIGSHSSTVGYECDEFHFFVIEPSVQCEFGEWKGRLPLCKDSRCRFLALKYREGMLSYDNLTQSGDTLPVQCATGYLPNGLTPICSRGLWTEFGTSPCREAGCLVDVISNGILSEMAERQTWKWRKLRHHRKMVFNKINIGVRKLAGDVSHLVCNSGYSYRGKGLQTIPVLCRKGQWIPELSCLTSGRR